jgi:hypothetical protein
MYGHQVAVKDPGSQMGYTNEVRGGSRTPWGGCGGLPIRHLRLCVAYTSSVTGEGWGKPEILLHSINRPPGDWLTIAEAPTMQGRWDGNDGLPFPSPCRCEERKVEPLALSDSCLWFLARLV